MIRERLASLIHPTPRFVEQGGNPIGRQPYVAEGATIVGFVLDADPGPLTALVDRNLNAPRGPLALGSFVPLLPKVFFVAADLPVLRSAHPTDAARGFTPETDFAFWVPVAFVRRVGPVRWIEWIGFFLPYLFVDEGWALTAGRETFGMPKLISKNSFPGQATDPGLFTVDTQVIPTYGANARATTERLVTTRRTDAPQRGPLTSSVIGEATLLERLFVDALRAGSGLTVPGLGLFVELASCVAKTSSRVVTLKQFRDAEDPTTACYQALLDGSFSYRNFRGAGLLEGSWDVEIAAFDSHPLIRELGLKSRQTASAATWMQLDFTMNAARTLWQAR